MSSFVKYSAALLLASQAYGLTCYQGTDSPTPPRLVSSADNKYCVTFVTTSDNKKNYAGISSESLNDYQYNKGFKNFTKCTTDYCNGPLPPAETRILTSYVRPTSTTTAYPYATKSASADYTTPEYKPTATAPSTGGNTGGGNTGGGNNNNRISGELIKPAGTFAIAVLLVLCLF